MIFPREMIDSVGIEGLNKFADEYYLRISDPTDLMTKPFSSLSEIPSVLYQLGLLFNGLNLGKDMVVVDFGAGSCWLSYWIAQMKCKAIAVDVSPTALQIGKKLFERAPLGAIHNPQFLQYDGHHIDLPDQSVDRIICFGSFHHVPNRSEILGELCRILKDGGMMGFSEPGLEHSKSQHSQSEMRDFQVLEDTLTPSDLLRDAHRLGLEVTFAPISDLRPPVQYKQLFTPSTPSINNLMIFFMTKGELSLDSRSIKGLSYKIIKIKRKEVGVEIIVKNTGVSTWLSSGILGRVQLGAHLYDPEGNLLNYDYARVPLPKSVAPGERVKFELQASGNLIIDMVSEGVTWFEQIGCRPVRLQLD